ncbi:hypothetical protein [Microbacterium sp.]|uniref:hypothetical protein n=1 Tax=Microbacterium sp. TaxID=51671 RepID=UPI003F72A0BC
MAGAAEENPHASDPPEHDGLVLVRIDADHWLIHDSGHPTTDARHVVACIEESEDGMDVVWVAPGVPLPTRYRTAGDILDDLVRWREGSRRDTRPAAIASFPPPTSRRRSS